LKNGSKIDIFEDFIMKIDISENFGTEIDIDISEDF
jgi:hypothetical protein